MKKYMQFNEEKDSKEKAKYQNHPNGKEMCNECTMWRPPNNCTAVAGEISPSGWCSYFKKKNKS